MSLQFEWDPKKAEANVVKHKVSFETAITVFAMKKISARRKNPRKKEELRSEYRFDYSKSKPNRFAAKMTEGTVAVVLDPDVAAVFQSSDAVNAFLRSVISATSVSKEKRRH